MKMVSLFADHKDCDLLAVNKSNETIFNIACRLKMTDALSFLFSKITSYPPKLLNYLGQTLLHIACSTNSLDTVTTLANFGAIYSLGEDINLTDKINELTPLQFACTENDVSLLKYLIEVTDCDPDTRNKTGDTVFHICCKNNFVDIANALKERCSMTVRNQLGDTPLHVACKNNNHELALILLKHLTGNIKECYNRKGDTVLHVAAGRSNAVRVVRYMVENNICDPTKPNETSGNMALHTSCSNNQLDSTLYLFQLDYDGAQDSWFNREKKSPLSISLQNDVSFILSIISNNLVKPWQFLKCVQMKHPFKKLKHQLVQTDDYIDLPLPHHLIQFTFGDHTGHRLSRSDIFPRKNYSTGAQKYEMDLNRDALLAPHSAHRDSPESSREDSSLSSEDDSPTEKHRRNVRFATKHNHSMHSRKFCNDDCEEAKIILLKLIDSVPSVLTMVDSQGCTLLHYLALSQCPRLDKLATKIIELDVIDHMAVDKFGNSALHFACLCKNEPMIFKILQQANGYQLLHKKNTFGQNPPDMFKQSENGPCVDYLIAWGADQVLGDSDDSSDDARIISYRSFRVSHAPSLVSKSSKSSSVGIILLGNSSNGKTTLIHTLKAMLTDDRNLELVSKPTTGIVTDEIKSFKDDYWYTFHDFAGQIEFETSHSLRLESLLTLAAETPSSSPFVFLLLVKATDSCDDNKKQTDRWVSFIRRHVKITNRGIHLALVCSHDDCFENDALRKTRKAELEEHLKNLDVSTLNIYGTPILLNGLKTDTVPLNKLLRYIDDMFLSCKPSKLNQACEELNSLLEKWYSKKPCQIKDVVKKIENSRKFQLKKRKIVVKGHKLVAFPCIPHELNKLVQLLKQLHVQNYIILLMPSDDKLDWWVISKPMENILFSKVMSIFSPDGFEDSPSFNPTTHNTGVIPTSKIREMFSDLDLSIELLENYLICMEFCNVIDDEEVLKLTLGEEITDGKQKCFFFPGLIKQEKMTITSKKSASAYSCGWLLENQRDLGLRFLHTLLLRLTFKFVSDKCKSGGAYERRLSLWKNGMFWNTKSGISVLIEVVNDRKVVALFQCSSEKCYLLAKLRSGIISEIHKVLQSSTELQHPVECYLYPPPTDFSDYDSFLSPQMDHSCRIPVSDLVKCFQEEPDSRSVYISDDSETASLQDILGFDSYIPLKKSTLKRLKKDDIFSVQKVFSELPLKHIEDILESDSSAEEWVEANGEKSVAALATKLENYSIFKLNDFNIV